MKSRRWAETKSAMLGALKLMLVDIRNSVREKITKFPQYYNDLFPLIFIIVLMFLAFSVVNLRINNISILGDELIHQLSAKYFFSKASLLNFGTPYYLYTAAANFPSDFYSFVYHYAYKFGTSSYEAVQGLNLLFYVLTALPFYGVCRRFINQPSALIATVLMLISANLIFVPHIVAEPMFFFFIWLFILTYVESIFRNFNYVLTFLSGAILALSYYIKPHAFFVLIGLIVTLVAITALNPKLLKKIFLSISIATLSFLFFLILDHFIFSGKIALTLGVYSDSVNTAVTNFIDIGNLKDIINNLPVHLTILLVNYWLPLLIIAWVLITNLKSLTLQEQFLLIFPLITIFVIILGTGKILFPVNTVEKLRLHGRYYLFLVPIFAIIYFKFYTYFFKMKFRSVLVLVIGAAIFLSTMIILPKFNLILFDDVEMSWGIALGSSNWIWLLIEIVVILYYLVVRIPSRYVFIGLLVFTSLFNASQFLKTRISPQLLEWQQAAQTVETIVKNRNNGVVFFYGRTTDLALGYFLSEFDGLPQVIGITDPKIDSSVIPSGVDWVVILNNVARFSETTLNLDISSQCIIRKSAFTFISFVKDSCDSTSQEWSFLEISSSLNGVYSLPLEWKLPPWGGPDQHFGFWLGHGQKDGLGFGLHSDTDQKIQLGVGLSAGWASTDNTRDVVITVTNAKGETQKEISFADPINATIDINLAPGKNIIYFTVTNEANNVLKPPQDNRPALVLIKKIMVYGIP